MKIEDHREPGPKLRTLLESESRGTARETSEASEGLTECPTESEPLEPVRIMMWNLPELGGGLYRPAARDPEIIDAYATLLIELELDICVLMGLRKEIGFVPEPHDNDGNPHLVMRATPVDSGKAEVERIVTKLRADDPGGGWAVQYPKDPGSGSLLYIEQTTTCFLYRAAAGIDLSTLELYGSPVDPRAGLSGVLVGARFSAPSRCARDLVVVAPLGAPPPSGTPERSPCDEPAWPLVSPTPKTCIVALSGADNLKGSASLSKFKAEWGAIYRAPRNEGSDLHDGFWERTVDDNLDLLVNFLAKNPADVRRQDEQMHWQALEAPAHPEALDQVVGTLRDTLLVCHRAEKGGPRAIDELRVVDLARAMLTVEQLERLETAADETESGPGDATAPDPTGAARPTEDGALAKFCAKQREAHDDEPERHPANTIAEVRHACEELSSRFPVLVQLEFENE